MMPAIVVATIASTTMMRKFRWMPGSSAASPVTSTWMPSPPLASM